MSRRVAITAVGMVTAVGTEPAALLRRPPAQRPDEAAPEAPAAAALPRSRLVSASTARLLAAAEAGVRAAGPGLRELAGERLALAVAIGPELGLDGVLPAVRAACDAHGAWDPRRFAAAGQRAILPLWYVREHPVAGTGLLAARCGAAGESRVVAAEGAGGLQAIGEALACLRRGDADAVLCGATATECAPFKAYYGRARAAAAGPPGFGAGVVVLEGLEGARRRGAPVLAEVLGSASVCAARAADAMAGAMAAALEDAACAPAAVDAVGAHGHPPPAGCPDEAEALAATFGAGRLPAAPWALRPLLGDVGAAAGVLNTIAAVAWLQDADARLPTARPATALVNAAWGPVAAAVVLGAPRGEA